MLKLRRKGRCKCAGIKAHKTLPCFGANSDTMTLLVLAVRAQKSSLKSSNCEVGH